jgi:DNA-binding response OmpR family regulator
VSCSQKKAIEVLLAENGAAALVILATVRPVLITLDLDLPDINGAVVLNLLREQEETQDVPVAIVSARTAIPTDVQAQAQAMIEKPFSVENLLAVVQQLLPPLHAREVGSYYRFCQSAGSRKEHCRIKAKRAG